MIKKGLLSMILIFFCFCYTVCLAESVSYTIGGSREDWATGFLVSEDGLIIVTGYTDSYDGSFGGYTGNGRRAFVLGVDINGKGKFLNYLQEGEGDYTLSPHFMQDGTIGVFKNTASLSGKIEKTEWIAFDREGNETKRIQLNKDAEYIPLLNGFIEKKSQEGPFYVLDTEFRIVSEFTDLGMDEWLRLVCEPFTLMATNDGLQIYRLDEAGGLELFTHITGFPADRLHNTILPLNDGGILACGYYTNGIPQGLLTRWNRDGEIVFDTVFPDVDTLHDLVKLPDGYAALYWTRGGITHLVHFDKMGAILDDEIITPTCDKTVIGLQARLDGTMVEVENTGSILVTVIP